MNLLGEKGNLLLQAEVTKVLDGKINHSDVYSQRAAAAQVALASGSSPRP